MSERTPLGTGNRYTYEGFPSGFEIKWFTFKENDGLPGVAIKWFGFGGKRGSRQDGFYPFKSEEAFWQHLLFRSAVDAPTDERITIT